MTQLTDACAAITRFLGNENRVDVFVNDPDETGYYTTSESEQVETLQHFMDRLGVLYGAIRVVRTEAEMLAAEADANIKAWLPAEAFTLTNARVITKPVYPLVGGIISTDGKLLTFSESHFLPGKVRTQVFNSSPGEVVGLNSATPEMFGGAADSNGAAGNGTDSLNALQCCTSALTKAGVIELDARFSTYYRISDYWDIRNTTLNSGHRVVICGPKDSNRNARIYLDNDTASYALYYSGSGHKINIHDMIIISTYNFGSYTSGGTTFHPGTGIYVTGVTEFEFENVSLSGFDTGLYGYDTYKLKHYGGQIAKCRKGMNLDGIQLSADIEQTAFSYCGDNGTPANGYSLRNYWGGNTSIKRCRFEHSWRSLGIILEKSQVVEVADNNFESFTVSRAIKLMGSSTESLASVRNWTTGFSIHNNRFWNSLGITVFDGVGWGSIDDNTWINSNPETMTHLEADTTTAILTTGVTDWNTVRNIRYGKGNSWLHGIAPTLHVTSGRTHAFNYDGYRRLASAPATGTWKRGDKVEISTAPGYYWICSKDGTGGELNGSATTGIVDIVVDDQRIALNSLTGIFPGAQVTIAGAGAAGVDLEATIGGVDPGAAQTITAISKANPAVVTIADHTFLTGQTVTIADVGGMVEITDGDYTVTRIDDDTFSLDGINSTAYTTFTTGGTASTLTAYFYPAASTSVTAAAISYTAFDFHVAGLNTEYQSVVYAASVAPDLSLGCLVGIGELTGDIEIANPTNISTGEKFIVLLRADGTARSITYGANFRAGAPASISASQYLALEFIQAATGAGGIRFIGIVGLPAASVNDVNTGTSTTTAVTPDALAGSNIGTRLVHLLVQADDAALVIADTSGKFRIPAEMNGMVLVSAAAQLETVSSSGLPQFKVEKFRLSAPGTRDAAVQMLSTNITVDENEFDSKDATTAAVISAVAGAATVATGDTVKASCVTEAGTGTTGGMVVLGFQLP